jgi:hypothetical protein
MLLARLEATLGILEVGPSDPGPPGDDRVGRNRWPIWVPVPAGASGALGAPEASKGLATKLPVPTKKVLRVILAGTCRCVSILLPPLGEVRTDLLHEFGVPYSRVLHEEHGEVFGGGHGGPRRVGGRRQRRMASSPARSTRCR